jgi:hypothetical protein
MDIINMPDPDQTAVKKLYRNLPRQAEVMLKVPYSSLAFTLESLEMAGFIGMKAVTFNSFGGSENIIAFKGKSGPCYDTGRNALYLGAAIAALDDDNHIFFSGTNMPVCEKTANLLNMPVYNKLLHCSDPDMHLLSRLDSDPQPFNCSTFEENLEKLYEMIQPGMNDGRPAWVFYPGPFRMLILSDGTIIKRGRVNKIPEKESGLLKKKDGVIIIKPEPSVTSLSFHELYSSYGARCLLQIPATAFFSSPRNHIDPDSLDLISPVLKSRLLNLIEKNRKFFILTGSDMKDESGCCPSGEVTEANNLVAAGILDSFQQSSAPDACPVNTYAFRDELSGREDDLHCTINEKLRRSISARLRKKKDQWIKKTIRLVLVTFILISLAAALFKLSRMMPGDDNTALFSHLEPWNADQYMVLLFHSTIRCEQCLSMEKFINQVMEQSYKDLTDNGKLQFKMIQMDHPGRRHLAETFKLYTASVVLIEFKEKQEVSTKVLRDSWKFVNDETLFKDLLDSEIQILLNKPDE